MTDNYQNWHFEIDADQIAWLSFDRHGSAVNTLNDKVMEELASILDDIVAQSVKGLVIQSAKSTGFIAGADIKSFGELKTVDQAFGLMRQGQGLFAKLEKLPFPTVAMINGFCLGGGCELALACRYRVMVSDNPKARIGLPEIKLGILPGWGGTVRLPKLIGVQKALPLILTGRLLSASAAKRVGLVNAAVPSRHLQRAARYFILKKPATKKPGLLNSLINIGFVRPFVAKKMYQALAKKHVSKKHYPAPYYVIENWVRHGAKGEVAYMSEAKAISECMVSPTSHNMVAVFFMQESLKKLAKVAKFSGKHVHVIGAGTMGGDIAAWCALRGFLVTLQDQSAERIAPAIKRAYKLYKKKLKKPYLVQAAFDRLQADVDGLGATTADIIIEAVFENLEVKQQIFKAIEEKNKTAILATNTSSIPLDEINQVLSDPSRLVGIHFFNPVAKMPLVEVVSGEKTSIEVQQQAQAFVGKIGKFPLPVKSSPGFLVNRVLMPYLMEALVLLGEGVSAAAIDKAALDFGMPMGPVRLADQVGLDVCLSVAENLSGHFGGDVPKRLKQLVAAGKLGCKTGEGFYTYKNGKPVATAASQSSSQSNADLVDRMILRMVNESMACLREGIVENADLLDAGMIFGTGFAPFRGGPMHYVRARGYDEIVARLEELTESCGERFNPDAGWSEFSQVQEAEVASVAAENDTSAITEAEKQE